MAIDIACPSCGAKYRVKDALAGRTAKCTKCDTAIQIPEPESVADDPAVRGDEYELAAPDPRPPETDDESTAAAGGSGHECPICSAALAADAVMCMSCGFEFKKETSTGESGTSFERDDSEPPPEKLSEREEELLAEIPISTWTRISSSAAQYLLVGVALAMIGGIGWWGYGLFAEWQSTGRINALVASEMEGASAPGLANKLVEDVPAVPKFLSSLFNQAQQAKKNNIDVQGLKFIEDNPYPRYQVMYGSRLIEPGSEFADEAPESWRRTAAIATLIANLPSTCDLSPLLTVQNEYVEPAIVWIAAANTDLDWQVQKSCDSDDQVRNLAARVLMKTLQAQESDSAAHQSLAELTPIEDKRAVVARIKKENEAPNEP